MGLSHLRFAAGVCVLAAGLLMGAGGAVAVADPDSSGSTTNSTDTNQQPSTGAKGPKKAPGDTGEGTVGSGRQPGQQPSTGATSRKQEPAGTDTTDETNDSGLVGAAPKVVTPAPKVVTPAPAVVAPAPAVVAPAPKVVTPAPAVVAPAPKVVTPVPDGAPVPELVAVPNVVAPVPDGAAPVPNVVAPVPDGVAPVPDVVAPVPDGAAPVPDVVAPVPDGAAPVPDLVGPVSDVIASVAGAVAFWATTQVDGVKEFPGPWALVPVGAAMLFILSAANRMADPHTGGRLPAPNRLLATKSFLTLGAMACWLYLWPWLLLIFWLAFTGHAHAAGVLLLSGVLVYLTLRYVENPLRYRAAAAARPVVAIPLRVRLRRPTIVLGSVVAVVGVALTVTSFTWREHVTLQRANGNELAALSSRDYLGARALLNNVKVAQLPVRSTVLKATKDLPETTIDGCISDFTNVSVINCTYGDKAATRTIALAGGSHAEHWITALDLFGQLHGFKVVTYLKMGCPLTTEQVPKVMGDNRPYPKCHDWNQRVMAKLIADHPDYVFTTSTRPWNIKPGDVVPATYIGIWQALSDNNIPILAMRDTPWLVRNGRPYSPADCLADGGDGVSCGIKRSDVLSGHNPTLDFVARFPLLKPLDMSDAVCRKDVCRAVEGNMLLYRDSHHLSTTYVHTMTSELGRQIGAATGWW